ncbi:LysR family transcriptional regulator [Williamsia sp. CHRR-6]|uniref:LysR family transcriptional regulator n=1 Tax=Williamsia sp. CHRR-6 TaxID=2835871 RepID=UPI001BD96EC3|nr:LysR family transcriptional regulator [Williamsia sp. CHRR-6]MBT0566522.1 LysR family transcriptional regulator [Williamsia sp. CHRR-6]
MNLELRHLRAFVALAEHRNYTRAAADLHIGQPALTRTIQQLERLLDATLVQRTSRSVTLTESGAALAEHSRRILGDLDTVTTQLKATAALRIGFAWLLPEWFGPAARTLTDRGLRTEIRRCDDPTDAVATGEVDIAITRQPLRPMAELSATLATTERRMLAVAADSELATRPDLHWDDLAGEPVVVNVRSGTTRADSWEHPDPRRTIVQCNNFDEWIELIAAGRGIGATPEVARDRMRHPQVAYRDIDGIPTAPVHLVWRTHSARLRSIEAFVEAARAAIADLAPSV